MFDRTGAQCTTRRDEGSGKSRVQSIEPHRILAPTRDLNREPLGPQSRLQSSNHYTTAAHAAHTLHTYMYDGGQIVDEYSSNGSDVAI